jgi:copper chaperone
MLRFSIPTMTCGGCARAVTRIVQAAAGAGTPLEVDLAARKVRIDAAATVEPGLREALAGAGYPAEPSRVAALG